MGAGRSRGPFQRGAVHTNPFAALPVRKGIAKRERVQSDTEIGEIWRPTGDVESPYGTIIRLLLLTGQRRGEVAGMTWGEISNDLVIWTLPGERTKMARRTPCLSVHRRATFLRRYRPKMQTRPSAFWASSVPAAC